MVSSGMEIETFFLCASCFQENVIVVDPSGGTRQRFIEDCQVCCRPNALTIVVDLDRGVAEAAAELA